MNGEYEIEHFGFTAEQLSLERKHFLQKIIRNALDAMVNKFNTCEKTCEILRGAKEEAFKNMWIAMEVEIELLNQMDSKYFTIPDHVLLPPYFDHVKSYTEENEKDMDTHIDILKNTFLQNSTMLASLKMENSQYKSLSNFIENEIIIQEQLKESLNNINMDKINELDKKINHLTNNDK